MTHIVGRRGRIDNLHIAVLVLAFDLLGRGEVVRVVIAELQESLDPATRVLGTLTVVTVGQRHDKTGSLHPLDLTGCDELVNDTLSVVGEITKLGLPHHQSVGRGQGVSVLETESTELTER